MKNYKDLIFLSLFILAGIYIIFNNPEPIIHTEIEYIKGDTSEVVRLRNMLDSLKYRYASSIDSLTLLKSKVQVIPGTSDTLILWDTLFVPFSYTNFNLGDSALGTSGRVEFFHNDSSFKFDSIKYRYPEIIKSVTDTLKITKEIELETVWYENTWFYSTVVLLYLFIQSII